MLSFPEDTRMQAGRLLQIGPAVVDLGASRITSRDGETRLEPKVQQVLELLVAADGALVSKDELLDRVWGDVHVTDAVVFRCIRILRKTLGEDPGLGGPIEMLRGRGYRLVWPVRPGRASDANHVPEQSTDRVPSALLTHWSPARWGGAAAVVMILALGSLTVARPMAPAPDAPRPIAAAAVEDALESGRREYARFDRPGLESAMHHFERALRLDPDSAEGHAGMALTLVARYTLATADDAGLRAGAAAAERAVALDPALADGHRALALAFIARGHLRAARSALERALAIDPTDVAARDNLAALYVESGRPDIALAMFQTSRDGHRPAWVTRVNQAGALLALGDADRAWRVIEHAVEAAPYQPAVVAAAAQVESYLGRHEAAVTRVARALEVYSGSAILWRTRGDLELVAGRYETAVDAYERVAVLSSRENTAAQLGLAYALRRLGSSVEADRILADAEARLAARLEAGDESFRPRALLARLEAQRGGTGASLAWLDEATSHGLLSTRWAQLAPEFERLRSSHGFVAWVDDVRSQVDELGTLDAAGPPGLAY